MNTQTQNVKYMENQVTEAAPISKSRHRWNIIEAFAAVNARAKGSTLSDDFWKQCAKPLAFLRKKLGLTNIQVAIIGVLIEEDMAMTLKMMSRYFGCAQLTFLQHIKSVEDLLDKQWIVKEDAIDMIGCGEGYNLAADAKDKLIHNQVFVPEKIGGLSEQELVDRMETYLTNNQDFFTNHNKTEKWMMRLVNANPQLPLCRFVNQLDDINVKTLLLLAIIDYSRWAGHNSEGIRMVDINSFYLRDARCGSLRKKLQDGSHILMATGYMEKKHRDDESEPVRYVLTQKAKDELLASFTPSRSAVESLDEVCDDFDDDLDFDFEMDDPEEKAPSANNLTLHDKIKPKEMFYNACDEQQVKQLTELLSRDGLMQVQQRLAEQDMRQGVACLFYGAPGTGKTETVMQIARQTGRDIMQVDISTIRGKYVGESEKNIKAVFDNYRKLCQDSEVTPILLFNEADGVIGKRFDSVSDSVEKMENAIQNILLQEIENLNGILIATTNLTKTIDPAFDRRFLFKVEFHKPEVDVMAKIWKSMIKSISAEDAYVLASKYDFAGGQIENIARKGTANYILRGHQPTLQELDEFCQHETSITQPKKKERAHIAGFA